MAVCMCAEIHTLATLHSCAIKITCIQIYVCTWLLLLMTCCKHVFKAFVKYVCNTGYMYVDHVEHTS